MGSIYDIAITSLGGAAPADGFIDPRSSYSYMDTDANSPDTLAGSKAKLRANRRYRNLIGQLISMCNMRVVSVDAPGAGADAPATSVTIRVEIEQNDSAIITSDEENAGVFLTGEDALKRCAARSLMTTDKMRMDYYDPTVSAGRDIDGTDGMVLTGLVVRYETTGSLAADIATAEAAITVTKIS